jgi:hypothetical protein
MIEYDAHEPGTWREAALHFRAENERLTDQLEAVTAERDALRGTVAALIRTFVSTHGLSFVQANAHEPSNRRISLMMEWGTVRAAVSAWEQERAALAARGGERVTT